MGMTDSACPGGGGLRVQPGLTFQFWDRDWPVERCEGCGLCRLGHQWEEAELERFYGEDRHGGAHPADAYGEIQAERSLYRERFGRRLADLERWVKPGRVLDVGSSVGHFLDTARARGWDPVGLELSVYSAGVARLAGHTVVAAPLERSGLTPNSFRSVTMWHVLEHLPHPVEALRAAWTLLEPGGTVGIEVPNFGARVARTNPQRWGHLRPWHLWYFTESTLSRALEAAGFESLRSGVDGGTGMGSALRRRGPAGVRTAIWLGGLAARARPLLTLMRSLTRWAGRGDENLVMWGRRPR